MTKITDFLKAGVVRGYSPERISRREEVIQAFSQNR
jgi:hypothetical protein